MDEKKIDALKAQLESIGKLIGDLPPEIRSAAFELLLPFLQPEGKSSAAEQHAKPRKTAKDQTTTALLEVTDAGEFFAAHPAKTPADAALLVTGYWFSQYGSAPLSVATIKKIANEAGLTLPTRVDMTLKQAKEKGRLLFSGSARADFKPTTAGELYLKEKFQVRKGNATPPTEADE